MMKISDLGEFGLIESLKKSIKTDSSVIKGIGDDCAVIKFDKNNYMLLTCDMIVEGVDFTPKDSPYLVGRKALAISLSDIAACGGLPRYALVAIGMPKSTTVSRINKILKGMRSLAGKYNINIVGGDISKADKLTIDVSMVGFVEKKYLVLRSGAQDGDIIFVSGPLGGSLYGKHLSFLPRLKESRFLLENFKVNSMIDISDGLLQDLSHILKESNCGAGIYEELIPLSKEAKSLKQGLSMGEDFELLFTLSKKESILLRENRFKKNIHARFFPIGYITRKECGLQLITKSGKLKRLKAQGFRHF
jgi:thiamine-monophosphate kinase